MEYHKITVHTVTEAVEALSYEFLELGCGGVEIFDPKDILNQDKEPTAWDFIDEDLLKDLNRDEVLMRCYFSVEVLPTPAALEDMLLKIRAAMSNISQFLPVGTGVIDTDSVFEEDWMNAWKKYYKPFRLGHHIFVVPSWIEAEGEEGDIRLNIDPGMAFGTGTHETTSMCMAMLEDHVEAGSTVFDIGCGSGILGIVAAKVGAGKVIGSDLDPNAVLVAKENVEKNDVADKLTIYHGDLTEIDAYKDLKADLIVANIIADVIILLASKIRPSLKENGVFISSGIIKERREDVEEALKANGFDILEVAEKGSWVCIRSVMR
ncbi:MAG: 50S ribosomal protein L11 methyltransferase [Lachnospiraceae bacterium]|nr:50S ribosomal protein L11 methyltransferase [Lachnospiraceae bacterium]